MAKITFHFEKADVFNVHIDGKKVGTIKEKIQSFYVSGGNHKFQLRRGQYYKSAIIDFSIDETEEIKFNLLQNNQMKKELFSISFLNRIVGVGAVVCGFLFGKAIGLNKNTNFIVWFALMLGFGLLLILCIIWISRKGIKIVEIGRFSTQSNQ